MTYQEFVNHVADRGGLSAKEAVLACRAALSALGGRLSFRAAEALAEDLPDELRDAVRAAEHGQEFGAGELYARVAEGERIRVGIAVEHAAAVLETVSEAISEGTLHRLAQELPEQISRLLAPHPSIEGPERVHVDHRRRTLAEGRPGGCHPLSEGRLDRAQSESVARSENPHGDTKLSSGRGLTQERESETLAEGKPGSSRPLSGG